jgi:predicted dithiol-disulfide oxidoreductase (DUF899 family)
VSLPDVVTREEWEQQRLALLAKEKELTRARDAVNTDRRRLPMVLVDKAYEFDGPTGRVGLADLFQGRPQLIVQHVMYGPDDDSACPSCTTSVNGYAPGLLNLLALRDTSFVLVSRGPLAGLQAYARSHGWSIPWYSSYGSDFNYDFHVSLDDSVAPVTYNYRPNSEWAEKIGNGVGLVPPGTATELPGFSCFLRSGDQVFHTYSTYGRGMEPILMAYTLLDLTAMGRQEGWEEPKERTDNPREPVPAMLA